MGCYFCKLVFVYPMNICSLLLFVSKLHLYHVKSIYVGELSQTETVKLLLYCFIVDHLQNAQQVSRLCNVESAKRVIKKSQTGYKMLKDVIWSCAAI